MCFAVLILSPIPFGLTVEVLRTARFLVNERRPQTPPRPARCLLLSTPRHRFLHFRSEQRVVDAYFEKFPVILSLAAFRDITDGSFTDPVARRLPASHLTGEATSGVIQADRTSAQ